MGFSRGRRWSQLHKYVIFPYFLIVFLFFNTTFAKDTLFNDYGNYLEWTYAKETKDTKKLKKTFKKINLSNLREDTLEELLFESIIFDDWGNGKKISLKLIDINKGNITANLFLMVENFLENKKINAEFFLMTQSKY